MNVPKIILDQIRSGVDAHGNTGRHMMLCWGVHDVHGSNDESEGGRGYLAFSVNGYLFKGTVFIYLSWNDTYTIEFVKDEVCVQVLHDVYFDELANRIDRFVENEKNLL